MQTLKKFFFALSLQLLTFSSYGAFIVTGEQAVFNFQSADFTKNITETSNGASFTFSFANSFSTGGIEDPFFYNGHLELGESIQIDYYNNIGDTTPFETSILVGEDPEISGYGKIWFDFFKWWKHIYTLGRSGGFNSFYHVSGGNRT